ncbi:MAG TPA: DUF5134 domain-containing protein [Pseudonocardiaceae bacterium]|nr:DUF5134 domain-containing protein [Pseudonocardiaceae bacterium]
MWVKLIFFAACLAVAGYYAATLITHSLGTRDGAGARRSGGYELSHLGMALGMAAMFSPLGDPVPRLVWLIVFGMAAAWFVTCLLHAGTPADGAAHHHLVANLAMLVMVASDHRQHGAGRAAGGPVSAGHEGHTAVAGGGWIEGPIGTVLTVVLAGYFAVHTVRSLRVLFSAATQAEPAPQATAARIGSVAVAVAPSGTKQVQAACQVVMGTAMVVMFGLML